MKKIEVGKTYTTRDGRDVRIYALDASQRRPIHGAVLTIYDEWTMAQWTADGSTFQGEDNDWDIVLNPLRYEGVVKLGDLKAIDGGNAVVVAPPEFAGKKVKYTLEEIE